MGCPGQCQPFTSPSGTTGCDLEPAFGCPRNNHTNRKSPKVKTMTYLVLSRYQHASECGMIHSVLAAWFIPVQLPCCFPFFLLNIKRKMMSIIFHDLPHFLWAYPPLTLKEKANYTKLHIKIFIYICTSKWTCDLAFSGLILSIR